MNNSNDLSEKRNELPPCFKTWNDWYKMVSPSLVPSNKVISHRFYDGSIYKVDVDFLKSKCFDELVEAYPKSRSKDDPYEQPPYSIDWIMHDFDNLIGYKKPRY